MRFVFHCDTAFNKLSKYASDTWMCLKRGEGEEEIANHGWSRVKVFSQETGAIVQRNGHGVTELSEGYTLKSQVQDAYDSPTQLPFFSSSFCDDVFGNIYGRGDSAFRTVLARFFLSLRSGMSGFSELFFFNHIISLRNSIRVSPAINISEHSLLQTVNKKMVGVLLCVLGFSGVACAEFIEAVDAKPSLNQPAAASQGAGGIVQEGAVDQSRFKKLPSRFMRAPVQKSADEKLHDVSDMYEKHFLREMMKAMRSTVHESGFIQQNQAEKIFREQLDDHYVDKWSEKGGIGLSKMIYEQLIDKFGVQMGIKRPVARPQGPLPLDEKSNYSAHQFRHPGKKQALSYRIDKVPAQQGGSQGKPEVKAPWDGVLLGSKTLADKQTMVEIEHDNGLKSQMVFKGNLSKVLTGEKVQAGETLGVLSPESKSLYWTVEDGKAPESQPRPQTVSE